MLAPSPRRPVAVAAAGVTLIELVVVVAVLGLAVVISAPPLLDATRALRVRLAAAELVGTLRKAEAYALRHSAHVAVKFRSVAPDRVTFALYRDGDGDGVLNADINAGVDPQVAPALELAHVGRHVRFGFPPGPPARDPGDPRRRLDRLDDPIRFNRSDLASFGPLGGSTPGSLYLTDGRDQLVVVRVFGRSGKVRVLVYERAKDRWREGGGW